MRNMSGGVQGPDRQLAALQTTGPAKLILLVDDSYSERAAFRRAIETVTHFHVVEATNGAEGVKRARELKPDLVLLDVAMPIMNGLAAAMILKAKMPQIPVVVLTMYAEQVPQRRRELLGIRAVLDKTDGLTAMIECLQRILGRA